MNQKLIDAIKNPPPERLAKIEYQSHALQSVGIVFVCGMLIMKGFWYIIFALIFGVGISYSQGMTAYMRYKMIIGLKGEEEEEDIENEKSWTRRRSKIITSTLRSSGKWFSIIMAVIGSYYLIGINHSRLFLIMVYPLSVLLMLFIFYFYIFYWIAYYYFKRERRI